MIGSVILIIVFTFLNAVFASAEIAVISMNEAKLRHLVDDGNKRAKKLSLLTEQPARFLATIQVAITLSGFLNSAFASDNFAGVIVDALISVLRKYSLHELFHSREFLFLPEPSLSPRKNEYVQFPRYSEMHYKELHE